VDGPGFESYQGKRCFTATKRPEQLDGPPVLLFSGNWGSFVAVKWPGH